MTSTVDERRLKLQEIHATIDGVRSAPKRMPDTIHESWLPCVVTYPGPAQHGLAARDRRREDREYVVRLYVRPFTLGKDTDQGFSECVPFLDRFVDKYMDDSVVVPSTGEWEELRFEAGQGDGGVGIIPLHGVRNGPQYWGIVFDLTIIYKENL